MLNMGEHGELYRVTGATVANGGAGTPGVISGLVAGESRYTVLDATAGRIKLSKGKHLVRAHVAATVATADAAASLYIGTRNDGTIAAVAKSQAKGLVLNGDPSTLTSECVIESTGETEVLAMIANEDSGTNLITVQSIQLLAIGLDTQPPRPGTP